MGYLGTKPASQVIDASLIANGTITSEKLAPGAGGVPSGTVMLFVQSAAPTGWTKRTDHNDKSLRVVSGTAGSGGSVDFTAAFASRAVTGSVGASGATTLSSNEIPSHNHQINLVNGAGWGANCSQYNSAGGFTNNPGRATSVSTGGGGSHSHAGGTFTGNPIDLSVKYVDVILATKE